MLYRWKATLGYAKCAVETIGGRQRPLSFALVGRDPVAGGRDLIDILVVGRDPIILWIGMNYEPHVEQIG